jgi:hypothetical protein
MTLVFMAKFLVLLISVPCIAQEINFTHKQLTSNLYCNDFQVDLSKYPLIDICDEITKRKVAYVNENLLEIYEILKIYNRITSVDTKFYTKEYLEKSSEWMSRAEFEANMRYQFKVTESIGLYYNKKFRALYFSGTVRGGSYLETVSCGDNYYFNTTDFYVHVRGYDAILDRVIEKKAINEYEPGTSFIPVIYPDANEDFSYYDDGIAYDIRSNRRMELVKNDVLLHPDSPFLMQKYKIYERFNANDKNNYDFTSYYIPLQLTYEALGYAVMNDAEKQNYFIYSEDYLKESPNWKSIEKMQNIFAALGKLTGKNVTLRYDENEKILFFENEAESVGVATAAFVENSYVRVTDAMDAYKRIANTDNGSNNALNSILSSL